MNKKFDWDKWHRKALEDSKLENQIFNSIPQSSFEELYDYIAELEATIERLIAAGESLTRVAEWRYANLTELLAWDTLVEKIHKEREK